MKAKRTNILTIKHFFRGLLLLLFLCSISTTSLAGDIPESLAYNWDTLLYFGEVKSLDETSITILPVLNLKGDLTIGEEITYPADFMFTETPAEGATYLCGYFDENNPLYLWETDSQNPETLIIQHDDDMSKRMQKYLNEGIVQETEQKRLDYLKFQAENASSHSNAASHNSATNPASGTTAAKPSSNGASSVGIIGGADGPTAIFIAGNQPSNQGSFFGNNMLLSTIMIGVVLIGILCLTTVIVYFIRKNHKDKGSKE